MSDLVERQVAENAICNACGKIDCDQMDTCEKVKLPSAQPEPPWTPCSKKLPEENGDYWVTVDPQYVPPGYRSTDMITWRDGKWVMADYFVLDGEGLKKPEYKVVEAPLPVIAWMPPPEPYKGGKYQ